MITLDTADYLAGVASVASKLAITILGGLELGTAEDYKTLFNGFLPNAAASLYAAPASKQALIRSITVVNTDSSSRTFQLFRGGTTAQYAITPTITLPAGYFAVWDGSGFGVFSDQGQRLGVGATGATGAAGGAPTTVDYLVGTADAGLSAEIVVGVTPGGELGGTWASPTVDAVHSGSAHHAQSHNHSASGDGVSLAPSTLVVPGVAVPVPTAEGQLEWDTNDDLLAIGNGAATKYILPIDTTAPINQAFGDAAAVGTSSAGVRRDHKHGMPADPVTAHVAAGDPHPAYALDTDLSTHAAAADPHTGYLKESVVSAAALTVLDDADVAAMLVTLGLVAPTINTYSANDTWTKPAGARFVKVMVVGSGGGSGGCPTTASGERGASGGGGGGGYSEKIFAASALGATEAIVVGAAGTAGAAGANAGGAGGTCSFGTAGTLVQATGGAGGTAGVNNSGTTSVASVAGGIGSGGSLNARGDGGGRGTVLSGGSIGGVGGGSHLGGRTEPSTQGTAAAAGSPYGGGAAGGSMSASTAQIAGAAGAIGVVRVETYF